MKNLKGIIEIVAYQKDEQGDYTLIVRQSNGYYISMEGIESFGLKNILENNGVLKLEHWVQVRTWVAMMDNEHEEKYVAGTNILKGSPEAHELQYEQNLRDEEYESQEQYEYEMRMDAHCADQELQNAAEEAKHIMGYKKDIVEKPILGDLDALTELKKKMTQDLEPLMTQETLPEICPECGHKLRHKMSGRVCDNYPCNYYISL